MIAAERQKLIDQQEAKLEGMIAQLESLEAKELQHTTQYKKLINTYEKALDYYEKLAQRHLDLLEKE